MCGAFASLCTQERGRKAGRAPARPFSLLASAIVITPVYPATHPRIIISNMPALAPIVRISTCRTTRSRNTRHTPRALFGGGSGAPRSPPQPSSVSIPAATNRGSLRLFLDSASVVQVSVMGK